MKNLEKAFSNKDKGTVPLSCYRKFFVTPEGILGAMANKYSVKIVMKAIMGICVYKSLGEGYLGNVEGNRFI